MSDKKKPTIVYLPTTAMVAVLVTLESWFFAIYSFLGHKDPLKQIVCTSLSVAASIFLATVGRKAMGGGWPVKRGESIGVTGYQACWITVLGVAGGIFHWWMLE
jgi:hypothetical protein